MIRVVIADDEEKVCQLICHLVDWKSLDMEIVGTAHNGIETLELIKTLQPDLVITDIRMPGYDGLELINLGKQAREDIDFIIISGYSHFEYAQSAIKYGVSDYLLKPIKKNELLETLNKIREKYRRKAEQLSLEERMKIRLQNDIDKLRSGFIEKLLHGDAKQERFEIEKCNDDYHFKFRPGCFQIFIVKLDYEYENLCESSVRILEEKVAQILRGFLKPECFDMEICFRGSRVYCVLNYKDENKKTVRKQLRASLDELMVQKSIFHRIEFTFGIGKAVDNIDQLKSSLRSAEVAVEQRLVEGTEKLIENVMVKDSFEAGDALLADFSKNIEAAMEVLDSGGVAAALEVLKERVMDELHISGSEILRLVMDAFNIYVMLLRKLQFNIENAEQFYETFSLRADHCSSAARLFDSFSRFIAKHLDAAIEERKQAYTKPIRSAKQYIQQNYMKPITLKEVSNIAGFNDSYFSSLFKKETGKNFLEYLSEVRMNKAKELLKETNLSIASICEKVGYSDLKHFTKCFRKYTGLNPNEFRKIYA